MRPFAYYFRRYICLHFCDVFLHFVYATVMLLYVSFAVLWCFFTFPLQFFDAFLCFVCSSVMLFYISFALLRYFFTFHLHFFDAFLHFICSSATPCRSVMLLYISFALLWCFVLLFGVFNFCWSRFSIKMATFATNLVGAICMRTGRLVKCVIGRWIEILGRG